MSVELPSQNQTPKFAKRGPSPLFLIGTLLWAICAGFIIYGWYQWNEMRQSRVKVAEQTNINDEPAPTKQLKLVPQADGTFVAEEVSASDQGDAWDATGTEDFAFSDTEGHTLSKSDLLGKPYVIAFVFTLCRGPCPAVTQQMRELQDRMKDYDFNLVTLTVDPDRDTPEKLTQYGKDNGANFDRWKFLTGKQPEIYGLIQRSFKMPVEEAKGESRKPGFEIIHSTNIMLVNAEGRVVGKYNALKIEDMSKLRKDLKGLAKKKAGGDASAEEGQN